MILKSFTGPRLFLIAVSCLSVIVSCSHIGSSNHRPVTAMAADVESSFNISNFKQPDPDEYRNEYIFDWPVDRARLSRGYKPGGRRPHMGIDLAAPKKTPVYAAHQGMVIYAGRDFRGFGNMILIESGHGWATL